MFAALPLHSNKFNFIFFKDIYCNFILGFNTVKSLKDLSILEVGSGRGGGLNYLSTYLGPKECIGVDFSENQVF